MNADERRLEKTKTKTMTENSSGQKNLPFHNCWKGRSVQKGLEATNYGAAVTWARRLRCQQSSLLSVQIGRSLP
jgi:hypothetical protein